MKRILNIFLCTLLITSCDNQGETIAVQDMNEVEKSSPLKDSLVEIYTQTILEYYKSNNIEHEIELVITGKKAYEEDSILILSFDEILKFGSWHYTHSSLCFRKNGSELIPILRSTDMTAFESSTSKSS